METHDFDVLVLGAGGAGLRAALAASEAGARVAVVCKSLLGKSQTVMGAALAAALPAPESPDRWELHFADTVRGARGVNHWRMAELLAREAPGRVLELEAWGALLGRTAQGGIRLGEGSGHRHPRLARSGQHQTGLELLRTLQAQLATRGIPVFAEHAVVELLKSGERVGGALALRRADGAAVLFEAGAVVVATGGCGKAYAFTSNFHDSTGDGCALGLRAGAALVDMEFVQFHPTGMVAPASARGLLVAESIRNFGGVMRNARNERFLFNHVPESYRAEIAETEAEADAWYETPAGRRPPELLPRDDVSRAIDAEIRAGRGTPNGGVWLDIGSRRPAETIRRLLPHMYRQFLDLADVDITAQPMQVAPTCHYMMGGLHVDPETCAASVPGLFAAGETAGGLHGANRLNGNGISELLVFGERAGRHAAQSSGFQSNVNREDAERLAREARAPLGRAHGENPHALQRRLQEGMQRFAGLTRDESGLRAGLAAIEEVGDRLASASAPGGPGANAAWQCALDLRSLVLVAEAIVRSALARRETRGAHVRADFPAAAAGLEALNVVATHAGGRLQTELQGRPAVPPAFQQLLEETDEALA
jgi:succinate dehydrogenase / fumarate reductase flavoprotein subunit